MSDKDMSRRWARQQLHDLVGFSDRSLEEMMISLGRSGNSSAVLKELAKADVPVDSKSKRFAEQLVQRYGESKESERGRTGKDLKTNAQYMMEAKLYTIPLEEEEEVGRGRDSERSKDRRKERKRERKEKKDRHKDERKRKREMVAREVEENAFEEDSEEEDERRAEENDSEKNETKHERQLREYQEFVGTNEDAKEEAERIKVRNEEKAKEAAEAKAKKAMEKSEELQNEFTVDELRKESRYSYLRKREERVAKLLDASIRDEEELFDADDLTEKEKEELLKKKRLKALIEERQTLEKKAKGDFYMLPDSYEDSTGRLDKEKREKLLSQRYEEEDKPKSDVQVWEEQQTKLAQSLLPRAGGYGKAAVKEEEDDLSYLLDVDEIDFVSNETISGKQGDEPNENEKEGGEKKPMSIAEVRKSLPVYAYRTDLLRAVQENQVLVIVGETGSGKTTQIPQYLHEEGYSKFGKIGCTQPRRVAAMSVAARVAQEVGCKLGNEVGYSVRFEDCTSDKTILKYMTDGMLLREFLTTPDLADYSVMMIDEAHERTLSTDILFGLLKDISAYRKDLRLIIASATLDAEKFSAYFNGAPIFNVPGRRYPVEVLYTKAPEADYLDAAVATTLQIHVSQPPGDILIFLTGQEEIESGTELLRQKTRGLGTKIKELIICPIYANLPSEEQAKVFLPTPPGARKVVLATNIAETSLTIDGICYVIDTGFCKQTSFDPKTGMESLIVSPVSKAGAMQRAGRAGRTAPGKCFRLFTSWSFKHELDENTIPEIQRTNLSSIVLMLKSLGIHDLIRFEWMDPPPAETLIKCLELLYALGALNDKGELTKLGRRMAEFPADPMLSKTMLAAEKYGCVEEIISICAMLDCGGSIFYTPKEKKILAETARAAFGQGAGSHGDHLALLNCFNQWRETNFSVQWCYENYIQVRSMRRARDIREQLSDLADRVELEKHTSEDSEAIRKAITAGYFYHVAKLQKDGSYKTVKNSHTVHLHPSSFLFKIEPKPKHLLYHQLQFTKQEYMRQAIEIQPGWLVEIAPHYYKPKEIDDPTKKQAQRQQKIVDQASRHGSQHQSDKYQL